MGGFFDFGLFSDLLIPAYKITKEVVKAGSAAHKHFKDDANDSYEDEEIAQTIQKLKELLKENGIVDSSTAFQAVKDGRIASEQEFELVMLVLDS